MLNGYAEACLLADIFTHSLLVQASKMIIFGNSMFKLTRNKILNMERLNVPDFLPTADENVPGNTCKLTKRLKLPAI